jgi:hypothetical protein
LYDKVDDDVLNDVYELTVAADERPRNWEEEEDWKGDLADEDDGKREAKDVRMRRWRKKKMSWSMKTCLGSLLLSCSGSCVRMLWRE